MDIAVDEVFVEMVPTGEPCTCDDMIACTSKSLNTALRNWAEFLNLLESHPHMKVVRVKLYKAKALTKGPSND